VEEEQADEADEDEEEEDEEEVRNKHFGKVRRATT